MNLTAFQPNAFQSGLGFILDAFQVGDNNFDAGSDHQVSRKKKAKPRDFDLELETRRRRREAIYNAIYGPPVTIEPPVVKPLSSFFPPVIRSADLGELPSQVMKIRATDPEDEIEEMIEEMTRNGLL